MNLTIDKEFRTLIPPLTAEEFSQLESNCIENGIQDSLKVWDGILIDGHNRYEIATEHGLEFKIEEMEFSSRDDVKLWIIKNQLGRRNLSAYDRSVLALKLKPVIAEKAKEKESERKTTYQKSEKSSLPTVNTTKELAKVAGVSHDTIHKVDVIENSSNDEVKQAVRNKEMSINKAYQEVKGLSPKKPKPKVEEPVMEELLPFEEQTEEVSEELAHTFDVFDAAPVAELGRAIDIILDLKENCDAILEGIKKTKTGSAKDEFKKQINDCGKFLAHIETGLIGW